jgi:LCP family protein required for cell wall assembly
VTPARRPRQVPSLAVLALDTTPLPRRRRLPSTLMVALLVTVVGTAGLLISAKRTVNGVARVPVVAGVLSASSSNIDNYLLVGSDSRAAGDPNTGETGNVSGNRSDTIMVMRYDKDSGQAALLSIPRDLYVTVPGHDGKRRINAAYNDGPDVLVQTVQQELGIPVHHYVEIDFSGFKTLVDALGGVQICFLYPTRDENTGLNITEPGCHLLDGTQALAYARSRHYEEFRDGEWHEDPTSDLGRSKRQRDFVNRTLQTALTQIKTNPFRAGELIASMGTALRVDENMDPVGAASSLRSAVDAGLLTYSLPVVGETIDGNAVLLLGDGADTVLAYFRGDGPPPPPPAA